MRIPYDNLDLKVDSGILIARLPWLTMECEIDSSHTKALQKALNAFPENTESPDFQAFLNEFDENTIFYNAPRPGLKNNESDPHFDLKEKTIEPFVTEDSNTLKKKLETLSESSQNTYDPLAVYGYLRGEIFRADAQNRAKFPIYKKMETLSEEHFFKALARTLQQTYFITNSFCPTLARRSDAFKGIDELMQRIHDEEKGHDNLIKQSLLHLGTDPDPKLVFQETKDLMKVMSLILQASPVCFAIFFDLLEGDGYTTTDPLVDMIEKTSKPKAALGLKKHYEINMNEQHDACGLEIAKSSPALSSLDLKVISALYTLIIGTNESFVRRIYQEI